MICPELLKYVVLFIVPSLLFFFSLRSLGMGDMRCSFIIALALMENAILSLRRDAVVVGLLGFPLQGKAEMQNRTLRAGSEVSGRQSRSVQAKGMSVCCAAAAESHSDVFPEGGEEDAYHKTPRYVFMSSSCPRARFLFLLYAHLIMMEVAFR